jgi:hypothetical protein
VVARFRDEQAEIGTCLAAIESKSQAPVYGDGLATPPSEARIIPASAQQGTTPPRDIRAEARKHVEIDQSILSEAEERSATLPTTGRASATRTPGSREPPTT